MVANMMTRIVGVAHGWEREQVMQTLPRPCELTTDTSLWWQCILSRHDGKTDEEDEKLMPA